MGGWSRVLPRLTSRNVQRKDPLALGFPASSLDFVFVDVFWSGHAPDGLFLVLAGFSGARLCSGELSSHLVAPGAQQFVGLPLDHGNLVQGYQVAQQIRDARDSQHRKLKRVHDHHARPCLVQHRADAVLEKCSIQQQRRPQACAQPRVEQPGMRWRLLLQHLYAALAQPRPHSAHDQIRKEEEEVKGYVVAERHHDEQRFRYGDPAALVQALAFNDSQRAKEEELQAVGERAKGEKQEVEEDAIADGRLRKLDRRRVEVGPIVEGFEYDAGSRHHGSLASVSSVLLVDERRH